MFPVRKPKDPTNWTTPAGTSAYRLDGDPNPHLRAGQPTPEGLAVQAKLAREIEDTQRLSGREDTTHVPGNFLPPEAGESFLTPAGVSLYVGPDPMPNRPDPNAERLANAQAARNPPPPSRSLTPTR